MAATLFLVLTAIWFLRCWARMFRIYRTRTSDWNFLTRVLGNQA